MTDTILHLLHRAGQVADETFSESAGRGITARQLAVLAALAEREMPSQTDLVAATGIDRSTMAEMVRRLIRAGLVTRRRSRADARRYRLELTAKGEDALVEAKAAGRTAESVLITRVPASLRRGFKEALRFLALGQTEPQRAATQHVEAAE